MIRLCVLGIIIGAVSTTLEPQVPVFRSRVEAVRLDVSVMRGMKPVPGLAVSNFTVTDNGVAQAVDNVTVDTVPLSVILVLDTSSSMLGEPMGDLVDGTRTLVQSLKPQDTVSLLTFAESVELAVPMTGDHATLLKGLNRLQAFGITALRDAVFLALQSRPHVASETRSVMLVFSDGRDSASWLSPAKLVEATRRSGVVLHVVELTRQRSRARGTGAASQVLNEMAAAGGGRRWPAASSSDLRVLFATVLDELRSRYLLTYSPANVPRDGWHDVKVSLKGVRGEVIARPGYYVPPSE